MMLYTNLKNVKVGKKPLNQSSDSPDFDKLDGSIDSNMSDENFQKFCDDNLFDANKKSFYKLFEEARKNNFTIILEHAETAA